MPTETPARLSKLTSSGKSIFRKFPDRPLYFGGLFLFCAGCPSSASRNPTSVGNRLPDIRWPEEPWRLTFAARNEMEREPISGKAVSLPGAGRLGGTCGKV